MSDTLFTIGALAVVLVVGAQPLCFLVLMFRKGVQYIRAGGYREQPLEDKIRCQRIELDELHARVTEQDRLIKQLNELVEQLWTRNEAERAPPRLAAPTLWQSMLPATSLVCMVAATSMVMVPLFLLPTHVDSNSIRGSHAAPTMHPTTSGGEVPASPRATLPRVRYCLEHDSFIVVPFRTVEIAPFWPGPQVADRPWTLWFYPEKDPPESILYIRH